MENHKKHPLSVLVVENSPVDSKMIHGMLEKSSYGVFHLECVSSLTEAYDCLRTRPYDVVLLDLNLPDSRGMATLQKLNAEFPALPIVVNTGAYEDALGLKAVTCGAQDYLIKSKYESYMLSKTLYYAVERKKFEQELQAAYDRLKDAQSQLIQVEKMNVVGGLASGVAHEVKNPLATILYGVEFLNTKLCTDDEQVLFTLKSLKDACQRANIIIKDLLDFASLSKLQRRPQELPPVIERALNLVKHQLDKGRIEVVRRYEDSLPPVSIDENRIEQVLVDLILNSALAMPDGGRLTISAVSKKLSRRGPDFDETVKEGYVIIVDIDDTGSGIAEENLTRIFDPFFTTRRAAGGVGLGLSIARTIVQSHDGLIRVENLKGGGARARVILRTVA
ncbi:MAG: response regulator [Candidatus Omnitrophota bacterium]|nr:response regulator [Candidatus Omnitrophota bacterium]MDZ4242450.1 response regulator [Candidatus Omnitrophota bacterium]